MEAFWVHLLLIVAILQQPASADDSTEVTGGVGGSVTFHIKNPVGDAVFWSFENDPIVTVALKGPSGVFISEAEYRTRFAVSEGGLALTISPLRMEDAGTYSAKIGKKRSVFTLRVFRELSEPRVSCEAQNCSAGSCRLSLLCSAPGAGLGNVSYAWSVGQRPWGAGARLLLLLNGSSAQRPQPLTCTARNPVSNSSVTVRAPAGLCAETTTHPPGPDAFSSSGAMIGIGAAFGIGAVLLLLIFLSVLLWKFPGWRKFRLFKSKTVSSAANNDCTTVYTEVAPFQRSVPSESRSGTADGESSRTVYSLVKCPEQAGNGTVENATVIGLMLV